MSKDKSQSFEFNAGRDQQVQVGNDNTQSINHNYNDEVPEWKKPFLAVQEQVAEQQWPETTVPEIVEQYETPTVMLSAAMEQVTTDLAAENIEEVYTPEQFEAEKKSWWQRFMALGPLGLKVGASVGVAVVDTYITKSPAIAGLQAFFTEIKSEIEK